MVFTDQDCIQFIEICTSECRGEFRKLSLVVARPVRYCPMLEKGLTEKALHVVAQQRISVSQIVRLHS